MADDATYEVKVLSTREEVEKLRLFWSSIQREPEADIDFYLFIVNLRPEIIRPCIVVAYKNGRPVTLLAGRIEDSRFEIKIGYKVLWRCKIRRFINFYGGFMGARDLEITTLVVKRLLQALREQGASLCVWDGVRWSSDLHQVLKSAPNLLCRDHLASPNPHWTMNLPGSLEELLEKRMNKKHRYWAKRTMRMLEKDFPDAVRYTSYSTSQEMPALFRDAVAVAQKTYQWGLGVGFSDSEEQKKRLELESRKGWLRGYVLYLKEEPVAFWICTLYGETIHLDCTGFDPSLRKYEVGTALLLHVIRDMCGQKIKRMDFGLGTALYKEKFGDSQFDETTMWIFRFSLRGILLNVLRHLTQGPIESLRKIIKRLGLEQKLKRLWRSRATPTLESAAAAEAEV
jgi:ribosomal protein S18 acetylase RimI-like enzyme